MLYEKGYPFADIPNDNGPHSHLPVLISAKEGPFENNLEKIYYMFSRRMDLVPQLRKSRMIKCLIYLNRNIFRILGSLLLY